MDDSEMVEEYVAEVERLLETPRPTTAPQYQWIGPVSDLGNIQRCECGALVLLTDQAKHDQWHEIILNCLRVVVELIRLLGGEGSDREQG